MTILLLNVRSICNKAIEIHDFITSNHLDEIFLTDTWLKGNEKDNTILSELLPTNYDIIHKPRAKGRGGGVAVIHRKDLTVKACSSNQYESFEHITTKITAASETYHIITLYRPPPNNKNKLTSSSFFEDFSELMSDALLLKGKLIIMGDFNIAINKCESEDTKKLINITESTNLHQHVTSPTHKQGNTIDLILTRSTDDILNKIKVLDSLISDHSTVHFSLAATRPPRPTKITCSRNYKALDITAFKQDIAKSPLQNPSSRDPDTLVSLYHQVLTEQLDKHAPLTSKSVVIRPVATWYNDTIKELKREENGQCGDGRSTD